MAKRKKKGNETEAISSVLLLVAIFIYVYTDSWEVAAAAAGSLFVLWIAIFVIKEAIKEQKIRKSGILEIDKMDGEQFEDYLRVFFKKKGYTVKTTPRSGDYGADLILEAPNKRIVIQAKRYKSTVGLKAVQEASSARPHYQANESWVVTNSHFTKAAEKLAKSNSVKLIGREDLIKMIL